MFRALLASMFACLFISISGCTPGNIDSEANAVDDSMSDSGLLWEPSAKMSLVGSYSQATLSAGKYIQYRFTKYSGYYYLICTDVASGDLALYSDYLGYPTTKSYQYKMDKGGSGTTECIVPFKATSTGYYYVSVYAKSSAKSVWLDVYRY